jgi:hypothetical protein
MASVLENVFKGFLYFDTQNIPRFNESPELVPVTHPIHENGYLRQDDCVNWIIESDVDIKLWINSQSMILEKGEHFIPSVFNVFTSIRIDKENLYDCFFYRILDPHDIISKIGAINQYMFRINKNLISTRGIMQIENNFPENMESSYYYNPEIHKWIDTGESVYRATIRSPAVSTMRSDPDVTKYLDKIPEFVIFTAIPSISISYTEENRDGLHDVLKTKYDMVVRDRLEQMTMKVDRPVDEINHDIRENNNAIQRAVNAGYIWINGG